MIICHLPGWMSDPVQSLRYTAVKEFGIWSIDSLYSEGDLEQPLGSEESGRKRAELREARTRSKYLQDLTQNLKCYFSAEF